MTRPPLGDPVRDALLGASAPHAAYGVSSGTAVRYHRDIAPFASLGPAGGASDWADLAPLVGADVGGALLDPPPVPEGWRVLRHYEAVRMVCPRPVEGQGFSGVEVLGAADLDDMRDLVARTEPGPFGPRTTELGAFLGVRLDGRLVAMAGERMHPPGWTEVSAVCTDASYRGRGLAARLVAAVTAGIHARGEGAFLHVMRANPGAIRVYEGVGYAVEREVEILAVRSPG